MADTRIDELRRRLERDPGSRLFAQLAEELRKAGELAEAIRVARSGLAAHPVYASARLTLGRALLDSGEAAGAKLELESALRDAPDNILASRFLAQAQEQLGDLHAAAEQYRKTLQMAPGDRQLEAQLAAVEARLGTPGGEAASVGPETTPPAPRAAPPPLPRGSAQGASATPAHGTPGGVPPLPSPDASARRAAAPPLAFASSRPAAPARPEADDAPHEASALLPPTLRIRSPQALPAVPPPPPAEPPSRQAAPPAAVGDVAQAATATGADEGGPAEAAAGTTAPFSSSTLAELYFQQGLVDRAADVYRQLLAQEPGNERARSRLAELESAQSTPDDRAARRRALERTITGLETLLAAVQRR